ncbi:MAG: M1 family metallopeptidase [Bacteroidota bacterium]
MDTVSVSAKNNLISLYRATTPKIWDIEHTKAALSFNWNEKTASGKAWIDIHPYCYDVDTLVLDAKSMKIDSVCIVKNNKYEPVVFEYDHDQIKMRFNRSYTIKDTIQVYVQYTAMPYNTVKGGSAAITDDKGLYFINTDHAIADKPAQIWTQGETESNSHWLPTIDKPNERFTMQLELMVPDTCTTLSNGLRSGSINLPNHMKVDSWIMNEPIQAYAIMFAIGRFEVVKNYWRNKGVDYYVEPEYAAYAGKMFDHTTEMLEFFSNCTGVPYPWNKYDQIVVRDYVSGAMENTSASLFGEFVNKTNREMLDGNSEDVVSHELFHQWFGNYVTPESWSNITLSESFADYGEYLWRKYKYGAVYADEMMWNNLRSYLGASKWSDPALVRFYYRDKEEVFDRISYQKGGLILHYLNTLIGDEAFSKAMKIYLTKNALQSAEATQWRLAVEEATGQDWIWFFNQWYYKVGHPILNLSYDHNDKTQQLTVHVKQQQSDSVGNYILPLKAAVIYGDDVIEAKWDIRNKEETFVYPYIDGKEPVVIPDMDNVLVGELYDHKTPLEALTQYKYGKSYISKKRAIVIANQELEDMSTQTIFDLALQDTLPAIRTTALQLLEGLHQEKWHKKWQSQIAYMAANDANNGVRAMIFNVLGKWNVSSSKQDMLMAVNDSSYKVAGAALKALNKIDKDSAYAIAKRYVNSDPRGIFRDEIWEAISQKGNACDTIVYQKNIVTTYGVRKSLLHLNISVYMEHVEDQKAFDLCLQMQQQFINAEKGAAFALSVFKSLLMLEGKYKNRKSPIGKQRADKIAATLQQIISADKDEKHLKMYTAIMNNQSNNED